MAKLVNRAKMTTATTGTGTITLGSAVAGFQSFADAGVLNGDLVRYVIEDGNSWEIGSGTYTASGTTLTRSVVESSNSDAAINLTGNAVVFVTAVIDLVGVGAAGRVGEVFVWGAVTPDTANVWTDTDPSVISTWTKVNPALGSIWTPIAA